MKEIWLRKPGASRIGLSIFGLLLLLLTSSTVVWADVPTLIPGGTISANTTWTSDNSPYILQGNVTVGNGATLTIEPGVEVQFNSDRWLTISGGGNLQAVGTAAHPITFTSSLTMPAAGDWRYLYLSANSTARLSHCVVQYAGNANNPALYILSSDVEVRNCLIQRNQDEGIEVYSAQPVIKDNRITDNAFGLRNATPVTAVDASLNYWGHPSGPFHPVTNPSGLGNGVSDGVLFNPWYNSQSLDKNNLRVSAVAVTSNAAPGDDITVHYTVENGDAAPLMQDWVDSVYLSADAVYDPGDLLLARITHTGGVAANGSYRENR